MRNTPTTSENMTRRIACTPKIAAYAPMVITRLAGWINVGEVNRPHLPR